MPFRVAAPWPELRPGEILRVVKLAPDGSESTTYPGEVLALDAPSPWIGLRADWVRGTIELDGLRFVPGDWLHEFFSPEHPFNVFSVFSPAGELRGWYANVTHPTFIEPGEERPSLYWHDLYVDLIALPDGTPVVRDEDELAESGLATSHPALHDAILRVRDEMLALFAARAFPFHER